MRQSSRSADCQEGWFGEKAVCCRRRRKGLHPRARLLVRERTEYQHRITRQWSASPRQNGITVAWRLKANPKESSAGSVASRPRSYWSKAPFVLRGRLVPVDGPWGASGTRRRRPGAGRRDGRHGVRVARRHRSTAPPGHRAVEARRSTRGSISPRTPGGVSCAPVA